MRDLFRAYVSKDISYELAIYFQSRYSNPKEGQYKYECFARAIAFYVSHRDDFDIGEIAVKGSVESGDLVSSRVVEALYRWFAASQWPQTIPDPSIDVILRMVRGEE